MMSRLVGLYRLLRTRTARRAALTLGLACALSLVLSFVLARERSDRATARLNSAAARLDSLTDVGSADARERAAIAWGYAARLRLGLESPFRLIEEAGGDPRLAADERHTVAWALLAHVLHGETHEVDPAALDELGPVVDGRSVPGDAHLALVREAIASTDNPRAAELAVRFAYTLGAAERIVDGSAPVLMAQAAAMLADREIARREAIQVVRSARGDDPLGEVRARRARRAFYVERPELLAPDEDVERDAIALTPALLQRLRDMHRGAAVTDSVPPAQSDSAWSALAPRLYEAGTRVPPAAPLAVTVQRYLPMLRAHAAHLDLAQIGRSYNGEMLLASTRLEPAATRAERRAVGRVLLAAAVAMRSDAQQDVWFAADSSATPAQVAASLGVADITFDRGVPRSWRPYFLRSLVTSVRDLRRVFPTLDLAELHVRFRTTSPADSALAMHDPRTHTLHLPIYTAGGTLSHELAHDLDRQNAEEQGLAGYRSDIVARDDGAPRGRRDDTAGRIAASLRALAEELAQVPRAASIAERPAEIFATRVDWFVASALAREGISNGFLSAVQDELLTGHVVHPERLRGASRSRSLETALQGMTTVAPFALTPPEPSVQTMLRWALNAAVDRGGAAEILRGPHDAWAAPALIGAPACEDEPSRSGRSALLRLAAESRARGWLSLRARWTDAAERPAWARAALGTAPWSEDLVRTRVAELRDYVLLSLSDGAVLPTGIAAYAAPLVRRARCG